MKKDNRILVVAMMGAFIFGSMCDFAIAPARAADVGYRGLMLGSSRAAVREIVKSRFEGEYKVADEGDNALVLRKMSVERKAVLLIELLFNHSSVLYKINVKIKKIPGNPEPDEVVKVIEEKYGAPSKRKITNTLDIISYWYPDNGRYEIFFHNITSWDKYDVQYTDTLLQKQKEQYDKDRNKKPVNKELDF